MTAARAAVLEQLVGLNANLIGQLLELRKDTKTRMADRLAQDPPYANLRAALTGGHS
jgi:hypothetical protein